MNKTERIKAGFVGKKKYIHPETGEEIIINYDDVENVGVLTADELKLTVKGLNGGQRTFSEGEVVHEPGDEFEDLEFLKQYDSL